SSTSASMFCARLSGGYSASTNTFSLGALVSLCSTSEEVPPSPGAGGSSCASARVASSTQATKARRTLVSELETPRQREHAARHRLATAHRRLEHPALHRRDRRRVELR